MLNDIKADYRRYRETGHSFPDVVLSRGFQAVASYRFRRWLYLHQVPFIHAIIGYLTEVITAVNIPPELEIGKGLVIFHGGPVGVNRRAHLGKNIGLRPGVIIGGDYSGSGAPTLRNNVDIGVGAKIIGNIELGHHTKVGANAVVTKSFPEYSVLVGIPAQNIAQKQVDVNEA